MKLEDKKVARLQLLEYEIQGTKSTIKFASPL
jgi:hypothetical protein